MGKRQAGTLKEFLFQHVHVEEESCYKCLYCGKDYAQIYRFTVHFAAACPSVPQQVKETASKSLQSPRKRIKTNPSSRMSLPDIPGCSSSYRPSEDLDEKMALFFLLNRIDLNVAESPSFRDLIRACGQASCTYQPPNCEQLKDNFLPYAHSCVEGYIKNLKQSSHQTGFTLIGWTEDRFTESEWIATFRSMVYCCGSGFFLPTESKSFFELNVNWSEKITRSIDEVIGSAEAVPNPTVHVMLATESVSEFPFGMCYQKRGTYATQCGGYAVGELITSIWGLQWMVGVRKQVESIVSSINLIPDDSIEAVIGRRFAIPLNCCGFLQLLSVLQLKDEVHLLVQSPTWEGYCRQYQEARDMDMAVKDGLFWADLKVAVGTLGPLMRILVLIDGKNCTPGDLYELMEKVRLQLTTIPDGYESKCQHIPSYFNKCYDTVIQPVHRFTALLNPNYVWKHDITVSSEIVGSKEDVLSHLVKIDDIAEFDGDFIRYIRRWSSIFTPDCMANMHALHSRTWWSNLDPLLAPKLRKYAIWMLNQPCSSSRFRHVLNLAKDFKSTDATKLPLRASTCPTTLVDESVAHNAFLMEKLRESSQDDLKPINIHKLSEVSFNGLDDILSGLRVNLCLRSDSAESFFSP